MSTSTPSVKTEDIAAAMRERMSEQLLKQRGVSAPSPKAEPEKPIDKSAYFTGGSAEVNTNQKLFSELFFDPAELGLPDFPMDTFHHLHKQWPEWVREYIPESIVGYQWNKPAVYAFCRNDQENVQLVGKPGSGKTTLPIQVASIVGRPVFIQSFRKDLEEDEWLCRTEINSDGTFIHKLPFVNCMDYPFYAVADEFNRMPRGARLLFNGLLNKPAGALRLPSGERIVPAQGWRCITTDNTKGFGDGLDMFDGDVNDISTTDRFMLMIEVPYLPEEQQVAMLLAKLPEFNEELAKKLVTFGKKVSVSFDQGNLPLPWTPRRAEAAATMAMRYQNLTLGIAHAFFNFLPEDSEKQVCNQILRDVGIARIFGEFLSA